MDISAIGNLGPPVSAPTETPHAPAADDARRTLIQAVRAVNASELLGHDNELTFVLDRNTRRAVVRIVNRSTRELVAQIPEEQVLRLAEEIKGR